MGFSEEFAKGLEAELPKKLTSTEAEALCPTYSKCPPGQEGRCVLAEDYKDCLIHREHLRHTKVLKNLEANPAGRYWFSKS